MCNEHVLELIERNEDGGWELDIHHPDGCERTEPIPKLGWTYACDVGILLDWMGLEGFSEPLPDEPGRYTFEAWTDAHYVHYYGTWEYDSGLRITGKV
jgi:hypothetical protein